MTSANVTEYYIRRNGKIIGNHYQSHLCKTKWEELLKFEPLSEHTIQPYWHDEEEEYHEGKTINLEDFLKKTKWKWMMDYCRERKWHSTDFWDLAEKAYNETLRHHQEKIGEL